MRKLLSALRDSFLPEKRKKIAGYSLIFQKITALFFSLFFVFTSCKKETERTGDPLRAISRQAVAILETRDLSRLSSAVEQNQWILELETQKEWQRFIHNLHPFKEVLSGDSLHALLRDRQLFFSLEMAGAGRYDILMSTSLTEKNYRNLIEKLDKSFSLEERMYNQERIHGIPFSEGKKGFVAYKNGVLLFAANEMLIEEGLRRLDAEHGLENIADFVRIRKTVNPKDQANIYLQYDEWAAYMQSMSKEPQATWIKGFAGWTALDLRLSGKEVMLSGLTVTDDSLHHYLDLFQNQKAGKNQAQQIVPLSSALWVNFTVQNFTRYMRDYRQYKRNMRLERAYDEIIGRYEVDFDHVFCRWIDREFGVFWLEGKQAPRQKKVAYFELTDPQAFENSFASMIDSSYLSPYRGVGIRKTTHQSWLPNLLGKAFSNIQHTHFIVFDKYVFFANRENILIDLINDLLDERTIKQSLAYREFASNQSDRSNVQIFMQQPASVALMNDFIPQSWQVFLEKNKTALEHMPFLSIQWQAQQKLAYTGIYARYRQEEENLVKPLWSADIDSEVVAGPFLVKNHYSQQQEVLVQDKNSTLYLFSSNGKLLWKKKIGAIIQSDVQQVDLFRNGKLQIAFSTEEAVHILDRNGDAVSPFPVKAPAKITGPLAVFDYDNNRNYRFIFSCADRIFNWDKDGKTVKGWQLEKVANPVVEAATHVLAGNKDYIIFITAKNEAHLVDRRGVLRAKEVLSLPSNVNGAYQVGKSDDRNTVQLFNINSDNRLTAVLSSGKTDEADIGKLPDMARLIVHGESMLIYGENKLLIKDKINPAVVKLDEHIQGEPKILSHKKSVYYALSTISDQVYVVDELGKMLPGFPVYGSHRLVVGRLLNTEAVQLVCMTPENKLLVYGIR